MDPLNVVTLARTLVDIDSTTGNELDAARWLAAYLRQRGYRVAEQPVDHARFNVFATAGDPVVVLSTHIDCVPPFFPSREEDGLIFGRGACDAKGILAAQVVAADRLRARGETRVGLLFVVGEERGSDGARTANTMPPGCRYLVNGEPTDNRLASATRGVLRVKLHACGRAAHSSYPELGESAIDKLVAALVRLQSIPWPEDPILGRTTYTVSLIAGGVAPNVVPPSADAEVTFRTVGSSSPVLDALRALGAWVGVEEVLEIPPMKLETAPGFVTAVFPFTTDVPLLSAWGRPFLLGPGSARVAHTDQEHVAAADLECGVEQYASLATRLLGR